MVLSDPGKRGKFRMRTYEELTMNRILLVEDQREFHLLVSGALNDAENTVVVAPTVAQAASMLGAEKFDLILLDISLPDKNGMDFFAELRADAAASSIPVIFLTGAESLPNKVAAFSMGAEDYVTKPFNPMELRARVLSKIRKARPAVATDECQIGPFRFKLGAQKVFNVADGREITLTPREYKLLYLLAKNQGKVLSRDIILDEVWGRGVHVGDRTVDTHMYSLRKKLDALSDIIESVPTVGYRFREGARDGKTAA